MKRKARKETPKTYVLDTSAIISYLADEEGADKVADILNASVSESAAALLSFMSLLELEYNYLKRGGPQVAKEVLLKLKTLPLEISFDNDPSLIHGVASIKAESNLSVVDAWVAALALKRGATLVHKDPEFKSLSQTIEVLVLPYGKRKGRRR